MFGSFDSELKMFGDVRSYAKSISPVFRASASASLFLNCRYSISSRYGSGPSQYGLRSIRTNSPCLASAM